MRQPKNPKQIIKIIQDYLISMWRYRWGSLAVAWCVAIVAWVGIYTLPDQFQAEAQVYVDTENILRPLLGQLSVQTDMQNELAVITRVMLSRPHLERVIRATDLDIEVNNNVQLQSLVRRLGERITITRSQGNVYAIHFTDNERDTAVAVVRELLDSFIESTLGSDLKDSKQAELTLKSQIEVYEERLLEAENRLETFKRKNVGLMGDRQSDYYQQLQSAISDLDAAEQKVRVTERRRDELLRQLEGEEPVFGIMAQGVFASNASPYDSQIKALDLRITDLLLAYTEKHPEVVRAQQMRDNLEQQRGQQLLSKPQLAPIDPVTRSLDLNPIYQNIRIQLTNTEIDLASRNAELGEKRAAVARLRELVDVIPQVDAELSRLNRDYGVVQVRYEQMLVRWETLQTGKRVRSETSQLQFRVLEPPYAAEMPTGPPKILFSVAAFVLAIGAGAGAAFCFGLLQPVFVGMSQLDSLELPILGAVMKISSAPELTASRRNNVVFVIGLGFLFSLGIGYVIALYLGLLDRLA